MATNLTTQSSKTECIFMSPEFDPNNLTSLPDSVVPTWIFLSVFNSLTALPTAFINFLIIWTIIEKRRLRNANYNLLLTFLAMSDLFVGAVVQPLTVSYLVCLVLKCSSPCKTFPGVALSAMVGSFFALSTLTLLSVERYFAVEFPFFYQQKITNGRVMLVVLAMWVAFPTLSILSRIHIDSSPQHIRKLPTIVFLCSNAIVILFCTIKVHITAYKKRKSIAIANSASQRRLAEQHNEHKRSLAIGITVIATVILYSPLITVAIIETAFGPDITQDFKFLSQLTAGSFIYLQSLVNPLIFALRMSYIQQGVKNKLCCGSSKDVTVAIAAFNSR